MIESEALNKSQAAAIQNRDKSRELVNSRVVATSHDFGYTCGVSKKVNLPLPRVALFLQPLFFDGEEA